MFYMPKTKIHSTVNKGIKYQIFQIENKNIYIIDKNKKEWWKILCRLTWV